MNKGLSFAELGLLGLLLRGIRIAMVSRTDGHGTRSCRPMVTQEPIFEGSLWFFSRRTSCGVANEVQLSVPSGVQASYCDPNANRYVSVTGNATEVRNRQKIETLWNPHLLAWFPQGTADPTIALLRVKVERAEYLNTTTGEWSLLTFAMPEDDCSMESMNGRSSFAKTRSHTPHQL